MTVRGSSSLPSSSWWSRPAGLAFVLAIVPLILIAPGYLLWDQLIYFHLQGQDFNLLAASRMGHEPLANLTEPLERQSAPLFRLLAAALVWLAGTAGRVPMVLGWATYGALLLVLLGAGHLVAWETRRLGLGLSAMVLIGLSTVIEPSVTSFSAGRSLWVALAILGMLVALQNSRIQEERLWFWVGLAMVPALLAPMFGWGGQLAGLAGWAYLRASQNSQSQRLAWLPIVVTIAGLGINMAVGWSGFPERLVGESGGDWGRLLEIVRAIPESLILPNLGLDATVTTIQALLLILGLAILWVRSRRQKAWPNPLEACGLMLLVFGSAIAFGGRDQSSRVTSSLEGFATIAQLGVVLFGLGWWAASDRVKRPGRPMLPSRVGMLGLLGLLGLMIILQAPRALELLLEKAPPLMESELKTLPIKSLQRYRARYYLGDVIAEPQRRALARLERASKVAERQGFSREAIRAVFSRVVVPGWPEDLTRIDALDLFPFPEDGASSEAWALHAAMEPLLAPELMPRPTWIAPDEPWPPMRQSEGVGP